jgi:hypothetical protein
MTIGSKIALIGAILGIAVMLAAISITIRFMFTIDPLVGVVGISFLMVMAMIVVGFVLDKLGI